MSLAIECAGAGDPILFIHGLGGSSNVFGAQVGTLARSYQCIRFDLPGAGRSPLEPTTSIESFVDAALSVLDLHAGKAAAHIVAHSMGTVVAQHLALAAPDRVRSLSLIGPIHAPAEAGRKALRERAQRAASQGLTQIADEIVAAGLSAETKGHRPELAACVREFVMRQPAEGYARHCEALAAAQPAELSRLVAPALLITGDEDNTAPPRAVRTMAVGIGGSTFAMLPRCGHWATLERPLEVAARLHAFLLEVA